ncbi:MAG: TauD/TfdA family dioxygenase [PS1 clade bacterium]|jgi:taurine dioxygenase|uniref:TauD/TfdA family dioxygenase n=1 Tax=PS1 clade bacterium TaxID=2175152 RepID=A0A937HGW3_9PROT|nr:TauD/TfdA family dioxygenase [PS1 clade bacterium]
MSAIEIRPVSGGVGVELGNVDIGQGLSDAEFKAIQQAFIDNGLVFLHGQSLSPEQHIEFAERFGEINVNRFFPKVDGYEKIAAVVKEKDQKVNIGGGWHTDHSYDQIPAMGSILLARETPPVGGDTLFACMYKAYESLSDGLKKTLEGMNAVHSSRHVFGDQAEYQKSLDDRLSNTELATQDAVHPVVITHPESGRKALYVNPGFTIHFEGWSAAESKPLLDYLYHHATLMEHTTRFKWAEGSIAIWDNRCTWHYALNDYHGARREMHRITVEGSPLN